MKRLICANEIEAMAENKQTHLVIDQQTIITPSAQDAIGLYGITVEYAEEQLDSGLIYEVLKAMQDGQLLDQFLAALQMPCYESEQDDSGFLLVHADSVKYQSAGDGFPNADLCEINTSFLSNNKIFYLRLQPKQYQIKHQQEQLLIVLEGRLEITIRGKKCSAKAGDIIRIPKEVNSSILAQTQAKLIRILEP